MLPTSSEIRSYKRIKQGQLAPGALPTGGFQLKAKNLRVQASVIQTVFQAVMLMMEIFLHISHITSKPSFIDDIFFGINLQKWIFPLFYIRRSMVGVHVYIPLKILQTHSILTAFIFSKSASHLSDPLFYEGLTELLNHSQDTFTVLGFGLAF